MARARAKATPNRRPRKQGDASLVVSVICKLRPASYIFLVNVVTTIPALAALFLAGCATLTPAERNLLSQHHVAAPVREKMANYEPLALSDIVELSKSTIPPPFIIRYVEDTSAVYHLRTEDVLQLRQAGVSPEVIDYLLATPTIAARYYDSSPYPYYYSYPSVFVVRGHRR